MRIEHLELTAFGPFTDLPLDLSGPGVHMVHGPNEAGKSSALAALEALLYGFELRTRYDFVHDKPDLKLRAVLSDSSGGALEVVRHKRNQDSLTGPDGTPIPESHMAALLNGVTRRVFTSTFALTLAELQRGGRQLLEGEGDLGQALYSARSGRDLRAVLGHLRERQEALYLASGNARKPTVNALMLRHKALHKSLESAQTRAEAFEGLRREVDKAEAEAEQLEERYKKVHTEHRYREKLHRVLPQLRERRQILARLEQLTGEGPLAPPGTDDRFRELDQERKQHEALRAEAERGLARLHEQMADLHVDADLSETGEEVASLAELVAGTGKSAREWESRERDEQEQRSEAARLWEQVYPGEEPGEAGPERVAASVRERIDALAEEHTRVRAAADSARRQLDGKTEDAEASRSTLESLVEPEDTGLLSAVLEQAPASLEESLRRSRDEVAGLSVRLEAALSAAGWSERWPEADQALEALLSAAVPGRDEVSSYRGRLTDHQARLKDARKGQTRLGRKRDKARGELEELCSRVAPPTEEELREQRLQRDGVWERIRVQGLPEASAEAGDALARDFEAASERADEMADRMRREAEAVNRRLMLESQLRELDTDLAHCQEDLTLLASEGSDLEREWESLWPDEAVPAPRFEETEKVLERLHELRELHGDRQEELRALDRAEHSARTVAEQLRNLLRTGGVDVEPLAVPDGDHAVLLPQLRTLAREELDRRDKAAEEHTAALHQVEADTRELERLRRGLDEAEADVAEWSGQWGEAAAAAGFTRDALPQAVRTDLDRLERAADLWERAREAGEQARRARQEVEEFDRRLEAVFDACGRPLPQERAERDRALRDLHSRAKDNAETEHKLSTLRESAAQAEADLENARAARRRAEKDLSALLEATGVADTPALWAAVLRAAETAQARRSLSQVERQLAREGDIVRLEEETAGLDDATAEVRVRTAGEDLSDMEEARKQARDRHTRIRSELERVNGSARAADLAEERAAVAAEIEEQVAEYLRLSFARELLTAQVEAYQQQNQGPILLRAQDLFEILTLGRFTELRPDTDDAGGHILRVKRRNGRLEEVAALSEGTADQLYLALRLASLERYAEADQAMPFVVDDVFMTFDDERGEAALKVLDGMADRFQVVVFTHHDHLADLAERTLPVGRAHLHPLPRFEPPQRRDTADAVVSGQVAAVPRSAEDGANGGGGGGGRSGERVCRTCGRTFVHSKRGRPPAQCPACRG